VVYFQAQCAEQEAPRQHPELQTHARVHSIVYSKTDTFSVQKDKHMAPGSMEAPVAMPPVSLLSENLPATMAPAVKQSCMPPPQLPVVTSNDDQFFHKEMRDIHAVGFSVESCRTVRICKNTGQHFFCDFLEELDTYENNADAHDAMMVLIKDNDPRLNNLDSLKVNDKVLPNGMSAILLSCPDSVELLKRLGVKTVVGRTLVSSQNASMYGKKLRDVHLAGFMMASDATIHFCSRNHTVRVADIMWGVGRYTSCSYANRALLQWIKNNDKTVDGLRSLVVDNTKCNMVCTCFFVCVCVCVCVYPIHARH